MNRTKSVSWAVVFGVIVSGCGPVAIRALDPAADGGAVSDVGAARDVGGASDGGVRCVANGDCPTSQYCAGNGCGTAGTCAPKPQGCTADYSPVCGCDGRTYANACGAAAGGARVATQGACAAVDAGPGGCTSNVQCASGQYCAGNGCGTPGTCTARPQACAEIYAPVCSCEGRTYANACAAQADGRRVSRDGACEATDAGVDVPPTGCITNQDCPAGMWCRGEGCDAPGVCQTIGTPPICTTEYNPVCSCDGVTLSNACNAAYTRVRGVGECPAQDAGTASSCRSARDCGGTGQECVFPEGVCGAVGTCELPTPCFRAETFCSCAGETYESCRPTQPTRSRGACAAQDGGVVTGCASARDCGSGQECVFPSDACGVRGTCQAGIACLRPETFCSCAGETYLACRPSQPTQRAGACPGQPTDAGVSRCAAVLCGPGTTCCESTGACYATSCATCCPGVADAGTGTACRDNTACAAGSYCAASACGGAGACTARPEICPGIYAPVCGYDGRTYSSACVAASQGVNVARTGECR
ncbi:MAG: Kazal-type serine protease inhibitor [Polyangiales bacterium]